MKLTEGGIARAMFRVAVSRRREQEASFFTVIVWRRHDDQDDAEPEPVANPDERAGRREEQHSGVPLRTVRCRCDAPHMPRLLLPITLVRDSYFDDETEAAIKEGLPTGWLEEAAADFAGFGSAP